MSWDRAMRAEKALKQIRVDHGLAQARLETRHRPTHTHSVMWNDGHRTGFWDGVAWLLHELGEWDSLPAHEAVEELRKGDASIYYPLFGDDPRIWVDCPSDGRVTVGVEGYCDHCGFPFDGAPRVTEDS